MSTLKDKAQSILDEKELKIIPSNIKKNVTIFDVTGTLDSGSSELPDPGLPNRFEYNPLDEGRFEFQTEIDYADDIVVIGKLLGTYEEESTYYNDVGNCTVNNISMDAETGKLFFSGYLNPWSGDYYNHKLVIYIIKPNYVTSITEMQFIMIEPSYFKLILSILNSNEDRLENRLSVEDITVRNSSGDVVALDISKNDMYWTDAFSIMIPIDETIDTYTVNITHDGHLIVDDWTIAAETIENMLEYKQYTYQQTLISEYYFPEIISYDVNIWGVFSESYNSPIVWSAELIKYSDENWETEISRETLSNWFGLRTLKFEGVLSITLNVDATGFTTAGNPVEVKLNKYNTSREVTITPAYDKTLQTYTDWYASTKTDYDEYLLVPVEGLTYSLYEDAELTIPYNNYERATYSCYTPIGTVIADTFALLDNKDKVVYIKMEDSQDRFEDMPYIAEIHFDNIQGYQSLSTELFKKDEEE